MKDLFSITTIHKMDISIEAMAGILL